MIRDAKIEDAESICNIYNPYILNTVITFEEETIKPEDIAKRMSVVKGLGFPYLVAEENGEILGYAYAGKWRERTAYRFVVESTIYLARTSAGKGLGTTLYQELIERLKLNGFHAVLGGITLPNPASVALHEKLGFKKVAHFTEVGYKFNQWLDVGFWQLLL